MIATISTLLWLVGVLVCLMLAIGLFMILIGSLLSIAHRPEPKPNKCPYKQEWVDNEKEVRG